MTTPSETRRRYIKAALRMAVLLLPSIFAFASTPLPVQLQGIDEVSVSVDVVGEKRDEKAGRRLKYALRVLSEALEAKGTRVRNEAEASVEVTIIVRPFGKRIFMSAHGALVRPGLLRVTKDTYKEFPVTVWSDTYSDDVAADGLTEAIDDAIRFFAAELAAGLSAAREYGGKSKARSANE